MQYSNSFFFFVAGSLEACMVSVLVHGDGAMVLSAVPFRLHTSAATGRLVACNPVRCGMQSGKVCQELVGC